MPPVAANAGSNAQVEQLRKTNEQLKRELNIKREKFSECAKDIISFCEREQRTDPLINKVPASENPYRDQKSRCSVL